MPCRSPITIPGRFGNVQVSCKQCLPCRINRQSGLSLMALFEDRLSCSAHFVTLTYADNPEVIVYSDFQKFLKRLRKWNSSEGNIAPIRYLGCGEYGSKSGRPHFHALIFNGLSPSQEVWRTRLWPQGFSYIGTVTPSSIRYTARYCLKFGKDGSDAVASWSKSPPLGTDGIRVLAKYMKDRGDKLTEPPTRMSIEGRHYYVNETMRKHFWDEFTEGAEEIKARPLMRHIEYLHNLRFGDPIAEQRKRKLHLAEFYESARFINERI